MKIFSFVFASLVSLVTFASPLENNPLTKVEADIRCEQSGGGIAVRLPRENAPAKVWQTESGSEDGLEVVLSDFRQARCPGCFMFEGEMMGVKVRGVASKFSLTYSMLNEKNEWQVLLSNLTCK